MARTTRATRQQRDVEGTDASPLVSLDDQPRRSKTAKDKAEDSSTASKKAHRTETTDEAPKKIKATPKKPTQDGNTVEKPAKAKQSSKKARQDESAEEATVQLKSTSKKAHDSETTDKTPAKPKQPSKKTHEIQTTEKSPVKAKTSNHAQRDEAAEEVSANVKKPRSKKVASIDTPAKFARAESVGNDAQADPKAASARENPTSPVKAARARARSPMKETPAKTNGTKEIASDESPTAENPTSPVKTAMARTQGLSPPNISREDIASTNHIASDEEPTAGNPTSPVKAALARAQGLSPPPLESLEDINRTNHAAVDKELAAERPAAERPAAEKPAAEKPTSPVKAALARAKGLSPPPPESLEDINRTKHAAVDMEPAAEKPTSPVKAALARAKGISPPPPASLEDINGIAAPTSDDTPVVEKPTSPVKAARARARSPAKPSPVKRSAVQRRQKETPAEDPSKTSPPTLTPARAPATQTSPQRLSSNDSTPSKRKHETSAPDEEQTSPSKRLRTEPKPRRTPGRPPAKTNGFRIPAKSPVKPKRYAKQGGYDRNGNLIFPGQELLDSTTEDEITKAPPVLIAPISPLAVHKQPSKSQNTEACSPSKTTRYQREGTDARSPSKPTATRHDELVYPHNVFNLPTTPVQAKQPSLPPATAPDLRTPGRRWNLAGRVTASIGKLNPFSFFTRSAEPAGAAPSRPILEPSIELVMEPVVERVTEPVSIAMTDATTAEPPLASALDVMDTEPKTSYDEQTLTVIDDADPQAEIPDLLLSVLQARCPDIADEKLVSTVQASFVQSEGLARHKAEEAQQRLQSIADPVTKRLVILLERQYPDLSASGIVAKLDELIEQQQIVAHFKQEQAQKHQSPMSEGNKVNKRKRPSSPEIIPNPAGKSYGMDMRYFGISSDSEDDSDASAEEAERPVKRQRMAEQTTPSRPMPSQRYRGSEPVPAAKRTGALHFQSKSARKPGDDPKRASPYTGNIFRDSNEAPRNIFAAAGAQESATTDKTVGRFEVPLSSSESEDSDDELPVTPSKSGTSAQSKNAPGGGSILKGSPLNAAAKAAKDTPAKEPTAKDTTSKSTASQETNKESRSAPAPPPAPTPAHAALPAAAPASQGPHDPVALARAQANKYAPKTSSKLKSVSRLSNSPAMKNSTGHLLPAGKNGAKRNASIKLVSLLDDYELDADARAVLEEWESKSFVDWSMYDLDPAVTETFAGWENMDVDPLASYDLDPEVAEFLSSVEVD